MIINLQNQNDCHFRGHLVNQSTNSWAAVSTCDQLISGVFSDGNDLYHIHPKDNDDSQIIIFKHKDLISSFKCGIYLIDI